MFSNVRFSRTVLTVASLGCGVLWGACNSQVTNTEHCSNNEGNRYCAELDPSTPLCSDGNRGECNANYPTGCVAADTLVEGCNDVCGTLSDAECEGTASSSSGSGGMTMTTGVSEDTTNTNTDTNTGTDGVTTNTDTDGTSTGNDGTSTDTGPDACFDDSSCNNTPNLFCDTDTGLCGDCTTPDDPDSACADLNPDNPVCNPTSGLCVPCTDANTGACDGNTPVCDTSSSSCVPCNQHDQCPGSACHIPSSIPAANDPDDGACFNLDSVLHVDGDGGLDFNNISDAVASVNNNDNAVILLYDATDYNESVTVDNGKTIAFLAAPGPQANWVQANGVGPGANPNLRIQNSATVFLFDVFINGNQDPDGPGIEVDNARLHAQRSRIVGNDGGSVGATSGAFVDIENCFVGAVLEVDTLRIEDSTADIRYSTVASGLGASGTLLCSTSTVSVSDSILITRGDSPALGCAGATVSDSAVEDNGLTAWFDGYNAGNYALSALGDIQFGGVAQWDTGDPATDINGTLRPIADGTSDVAGAFLPL